MKRQEEQDLVGVCQRLTDAAEEYVNRSPRAKRIEVERSALLDAIAQAQLVLSVHRLPKATAKESPNTSPASTNTPFLEKQLNKARAALSEVHDCLRPLSVELEQLQTSAHNAQALLKNAL